MSRLIVLSNRVKTSDNQPMAGGLAVALVMGKRICKISPRLPWLI